MASGLYGRNRADGRGRGDRAALVAVVAPLVLCGGASSVRLMMGMLSLVAGVTGAWASAGARVGVGSARWVVGFGGNVSRAATPVATSVTSAPSAISPAADTMTSARRAGTAPATGLTTAPPVVT